MARVINIRTTSTRRLATKPIDPNYLRDAIIMSPPTAGTKYGFASILTAYARCVRLRSAISRALNVLRNKSRTRDRSHRPRVIGNQTRGSACAENGILQRFRSGKPQPRTRRNLNRGAGGRITSHPRLGFAFSEDAEPRQA